MTPEKLITKNRIKLVTTARAYLGTKQGSAKHHEIINLFNTVRPDGWLMTYDAFWCAAYASAMAIEAFGAEKAKKYFPLSANCQTIITKAKKLKIWKENDAYQPTAGDMILYDWDDSGIGDNKGGADHIGIVEEVKNGKITVIEGNKNKAVGERVIPVNGKYIRGFVVPDYATMCKHPSAWYLLYTTKHILRYMKKHNFKYKHSYKDCALTWAGAKKKKTSNCSTMVCYALQQSGFLKPGQYFWINGDNIEYRGKGTKTQLEKVAKISHPHKSPKKAGLKKGDIVGYEDPAHTMEFAGWDEKDQPTWYTFGSKDVGDKQPKHKKNYVNKKIMTLIRLK